MSLQEQFEKMHDQIEQLKAKGEKLAQRARSLARSVVVHPDYGKGKPNEFFDLVDGLCTALAEWKGEKDPAPAPTGAVWVKGAPKEFKPHYAKVPSKLYDHIAYKAIVIPKEMPGYWWAVGDGFAYGLISEEIIEHLDESAGEKDDWISVDDQLPAESGRYWCYVEHLTDLGFSYFQWNCDYNAQLKRFSDMTLTKGEQITHWRPLPPPPKKG
jgi:hypothetical protein